MHSPPTLAELTVGQVSDLAVEAGALTRAQVDALRSEHHNENLLRSALTQRAGQALHDLTMRGQLTLCTRTESPCPAHP